MPVEYCARCKGLRTMILATSRVQVLLRGGKCVEITTRTYYCKSCRTFLLGEEQKRPPLVLARNHQADKTANDFQSGGKNENLRQAL